MAERPPIRSKIFRVTAAGAFLAAIAAIAVGCSITSGDAGSPYAGDDPKVFPPDFEPSRTFDGGDGAAPAELYDPLCHVAALGGCRPDQGHPICPLDSDGGAPLPNNAQDSGAGLESQACHVRDTNGNVASTCMASGGGKDGVSCKMATDCASGYECVGNPGVCRHYCCEGSKSCGALQFCDIQHTAEAPNLVVPTCNPVRPCKLLAYGSNVCGDNEGCSIVDTEGNTSCVALGPAGVGESCEAVHCGLNLACLGEPRSRKCYKLCSKSDDNACDKDETCRGAAPLIRDPSVGFCTSNTKQ